MKKMQKKKLASRPRVHIAPQPFPSGLSPLFALTCAISNLRQKFEKFFTQKKNKITNRFEKSINV